MWFCPCKNKTPHIPAGAVGEGGEGECSSSKKLKREHEPVLCEEKMGQVSVFLGLWGNPVLGRYGTLKNSQGW